MNIVAARQNNTNAIISTDRYHNLKHKAAAIFNRQGLMGAMVQAKQKKREEQ
ncbi:MAG: hypothetical protein PVH87_09300 [Desulfobacteraceae bacterium]|jgi:hypothetical protein